MRSREFFNEQRDDELELVRILKKDRANEWITYGPISLYIRVGLRFLDGKKLKIVDLATFEIPDETLQGKGHFSRLLRSTEILGKKYGYDGVYVESILVPTLVEILKNKGFRIVTDYEPPSMYKEI